MLYMPPVDSCSLRAKTADPGLSDVVQGGFRVKLTAVTLLCAVTPFHGIIMRANERINAILWDCVFAFGGLNPHWRLQT